MTRDETVFILGCGAIGLPLAAHLAAKGRSVLAVRTSRNDVDKGAITVTVRNAADRVDASIETISLSRLARLNGTVVIAAKSYANEAIAQALKSKETSGPLVIMQNGIGVEKPFLEAGFSPICRCVLFITSQAESEHEFTVRPIAASPIGVLSGDESALEECVETLATDGFPFRPEANIERDVWSKAIINSVFNSVCPLLEVDNGVFRRNGEAANLAHEVVRECITLTDRLGLGLSERELMERIFQISEGSDGILISTLQDIRNGRRTEIGSLNLEMARIAQSMQPEVHLTRLELLGKMILAKSLNQG